MTSLTSVISLDAQALLSNGIIKSMTVIDWGKAMARANEIIQKDLLKYCGIQAYDPELDDDCPSISTKNNNGLLFLDKCFFYKFF